MKKLVGLGLILVAAAALPTVGCSRGHRAEHSQEHVAPEPPPPTPDTTPIPALRTPAGLVLGVEGTPAPAPPSPAASPTPVL